MPDFSKSITKNEFLSVFNGFATNIKQESSASDKVGDTYTKFTSKFPTLDTNLLRDGNPSMEAG